MKCQGQSLGEYGLIGMLIAAICFGALELLGHNGSNVLKNLFNQMQSNTKAAVATSAQVSSAIAYQSTSPTINKALQSLGVTVTLNNGTQVVLDHYPSNIDQSLQVTGANGTTEQLLNTLESLIQQLVDSSSVSPEDANLLRDLANQGHQLGNIEGLLEAAIQQNGGNPNTFATQKITYNGKTYTASELTSLIGADDPKKLKEFIKTDGSNAVTVNGSTFTAGAETVKFFELLSKVNQLNLDPAAKEMVNILSNQIGSVANSMQSGINYVIAFNEPLSNYVSEGIYWSDQENLMPDVKNNLTEMSSAVTHVDSSTICSIGNGSDTGKSCN